MSRNRRTAFLGIVATSTFVWAAIYQFDVPPEELGWLLLYCTGGVLLVVTLAGLTIGTFILLGALHRRLFRR
jgi:hypothetical protein